MSAFDSQAFDAGAFDADAATPTPTPALTVYNRPRRSGGGGRSGRSGR